MQAATQRYLIGTAGFGLACLLCAVVRAGDGLEPRGSLDAVKVLTPPTAAATQPAEHSATGVLPGHPTKSEGPKSGALRVRISQGTKDGPAIGNDPVSVGLIWEGKISRTYKAAIKDGLVEFHDLPLEVPFLPVVTVMHAGFPQQILGAEPLSKYLPAAEMEIKVYEVTTQKPDWSLGIRQVTIVPVAVNGGVALSVTEQLGGFSPLDRAWVGEKREGLGQENLTMAVALPKGAQDVVFGPGMLEAGATVVDGQVVRGGTMLPGSTGYVYGYTLPVVDGKAQVTFIAPTKTTLFALYAPGAMKVESATGLELKKAGGTQADVGRQLLVAKGVKAGDSQTVEFSGIKPPPTVVVPVLPESGLNLPRSAAPAATTNKESK